MIKETMVDVSTPIPEDSELKGFKVTCPKHGLVSDQVFSNIFKDEDGHTSVQFICKGCLAEYFSRLIEKGELASLTATPVFEKITNLEKETSDNAETRSGEVQ